MPPTATATDDPLLEPHPGAVGEVASPEREDADRERTVICIPAAEVRRLGWYGSGGTADADEAADSAAEFPSELITSTDLLPGEEQSTDASAASPRSATRANLRASTADAAAFGAMIGLGESYISAFALAIGLGEISAGLVSSIPLLVGGTLQMISLRAVYWFGGEKRWIVVCATLQALSFIPLVAAALLGSISLIPLLLIASVYWTGGLAAGPPWNTWMESIVPARVRTRYFSGRTRTSQLCTLLGLVAGGAVLQVTGNQGQVLLGFAAIFAAAAFFRFWSVSWLIRHQTPTRDFAVANHRRMARHARAAEAAVAQPTAATAADLAVTSKSDRSAMTGMRLLSYLVAVQLAVQISGPYFSPYMLKQLHLSYTEFVMLLAIGFLSKIVGFSLWGNQTHRGGAKRLLWIGGVGIVPVAALWILCENLYQLAAVQMLSGLLWAAYELGFFLMFFETLPIEKRTRMLTYYNFANMLALCGGAFIGAGLLRWLGGGQSAYFVLFATSSVGRFLALGLLFGADLRTIPVFHVCMRVLGVRLSTSTVDAPILSTLDDRPRA